MGLQGGGAVEDLPVPGPGQCEDGGVGGGPEGGRPLRPGAQVGLVAQVGAVGHHAQQLRLAVLPGDDPLQAAVRDDEELLDRLPLLGEDVAGPDVPGLEPGGELAEHLLIGVVAQRGQRVQGRGDDPDLVGPLLDEEHPAGAGFEVQPPVDPVAAGGDVHPGHRPQQVAGGDGLHLRFGLGGGGQQSGGLRGEARLRPGWCSLVKHDYSSEERRPPGASSPQQHAGRTGLSSVVPRRSPMRSRGRVGGRRPPLLTGRAPELIPHQTVRRPPWIMITEQGGPSGRRTAIDRK